MHTLYNQIRVNTSYIKILILIHQIKVNDAVTFLFNYFCIIIIIINFIYFYNFLGSRIRTRRIMKA